MQSEQADRPTYLLVDGENIDATLGTSILGRRPNPEERPRWDRLLKFTQDTWGSPTRGLFFLNASQGLPMSFVQALRALGYQAIPLSGESEDKVVDIAIQRTLQVLKERDADVMLVSHDGDFVDDVAPLLDDGRRVGIIAFQEFRNSRFAILGEQGLESYDLEYDVGAFNASLKRLRIIPIEEFDPISFLDID